MDDSTADQESRPATANPVHRHTNHLVHETSPYLLQHAHNPVQWYPWGEEAFAKARAENKPIFLSIGYSTCYWCHVMERESFENEEVAEVLNKFFVAIKVDREERPDVDEQYMLATQLVTGRGGWPNSVWLLPDRRPFMAGTYFPRPQFIQVLNTIHTYWTTRRPDVEQQAAQLADAIRRAAGPQAATSEAPDLNWEYIDRAVNELQASYDPRHGGFGTAPKFPPHDALRLLIAEYRRRGDRQLLSIIDRTLDGMWRGGLHDHVGGGFHRYSTDERWFLPHFEKMLYDNAQLMRAFTDGYLLTGDPRYRQAVAETYEWLHRELTDPDGGFYSALDSESDGEEGHFYVWKRTELTELLGAEPADRFATAYGVRDEGNWVDEATRQRPGTNIPFLPAPLKQVAQDQKIAPEEFARQLRAARDQLLVARNKRPRPHRDDKILCSWNGLMIDALAYAGDQLNEPKYVVAATRAAEFILDSMRIEDGHLLRTCRAGQARLPGYLTDYAFFDRALIRLYLATGDARWLADARRLADLMLTEFEDTSSGGFYFTSARHEDLLLRSRNLSGGGNLPDGNGTAAEALLQLAEITGDDRYSTTADRTLRAMAGRMWNAPQAATSLLVTAQLQLARAGQHGAMTDSGPPSETTPGSAHVARHPVQLDVVVVPATVVAGSAARIDVRFTIAEGYHLYGPVDGPDTPVLPVSITLADIKGVEAATVAIPDGELLDDPVLQTKLRVYHAAAIFSVPVKIGPSVPPGPLRLPVTVRWQACDRSRCLPPETMQVPVVIEVAAPPDHEANG